MTPKSFLGIQFHGLLNNIILQNSISQILFKIAVLYDPGANQWYA